MPKSLWGVIAFLPIALSLFSWVILLDPEEKLASDEWFVFVIFAAIAPITLFAFLIYFFSQALSKFGSWFSEKEVEEINAVEAKIAAVEHELTYKQGVEDQFRLFYYLTLVPRAKPRRETKRRRRTRPKMAVVRGRRRGPPRR